MTAYNNMVDMTFGAKPQAWAVLHMLNGCEPNFADEYKDGNYKVKIETRLWQNCRESGFCLVMQHPGFYGRNLLPLNNPNRVLGNGALLVVAWGEHRNSDDIFVQWWITNNLADTFNQVPLVSDCPERAYQLRKTFPYGCAGEAADFIYDVCETFYRLNNDGLRLQGYPVPSQEPQPQEDDNDDDETPEQIREREQHLLYEAQIARDGR